MLLCTLGAGIVEPRKKSEQQWVLLLNIGKVGHYSEQLPTVAHQMFTFFTMPTLDSERAPADAVLRERPHRHSAEKERLHRHSAERDPADTVLREKDP